MRHTVEQIISYNIKYAMSEQATCIYVLRLLVPLCILVALSVFLLGQPSRQNSVLQGTTRTTDLPDIHILTKRSNTPFTPAHTLTGRPILTRVAPRSTLFRPAPTYEISTKIDLGIVGQYIVRVIFPTPIGLSDYLLDLANGGFLQYIPNDAFLVAMDGFSVQKARRYNGVIDVYEVPTRIKIDPHLMQSIATAITTGKEDAREKNYATDPNQHTNPSKLHNEERKHQNIHIFYAMLAYGGQQWTQTAKQMVEEWHNDLLKMNISANIELASQEKVLVRVNSVVSLKTVVALLAQHPRVRWIEAYKAIALRNMEAGLAIQSTDAIHHIIWQHGIMGSGQIVGVADTGIDYDNCFFHDDTMPIPTRCLAMAGAETINCVNHAHRKIISYRRFRSSDFRDYYGGHGTHVVASIAGCTAGVDTPELAFAHQVYTTCVFHTIDFTHLIFHTLDFLYT